MFYTPEGGGRSIVPRRGSQLFAPMQEQFVWRFLEIQRRGGFLSSFLGSNHALELAKRSCSRNDLQNAVMRHRDEALF